MWGGTISPKRLSFSEGTLAAYMYHRGDSLLLLLLYPFHWFQEMLELSVVSRKLQM